MKNRMESGDIDIMMEGSKLFSSIWAQLFPNNDKFINSIYLI